MEMRKREQMRRERDLLDKWEGHRLFVGTFARQTHRIRSVRQRQIGRIEIDR